MPPDNYRKYNGDIYVNAYVTDEEWKAFSELPPEKVPVITRIHWG
jgi:hypothetical protein